VDVGRRHRGHLAALHLGDPALRVEDEDLDLGPVAAGLDGGRPGVARGGADDGHPLAAPGQHMVEQAPQDLHRHVLEGQGRPVKQLEEPDLPVELLQGRDGGVIEAGVGLGEDPVQFVVGNGAADEGPRDARRQLGIVQPGQRPDLLGAELRPSFRQIEAAVPGQARQQHLLEVEYRGGTPGGDVFHGPPNVMNGAI
jgi:hypothetical protein